MHKIARSIIGSCLLLAVVSLGTIFFHLGALPLNGADEPRYARIAFEMYQRGQWITPILEGYPWLEKPPLYYWITIPFYALWGNSEFTARLANALSGLIAALTVFWLGSRLWHRRAGLFGGLILLTCVGLAGFARSASTDMPMTACMTITLAVMAVAAQEQKVGFWQIAASYVFLALAVLGKGPVAVILVIGIAAAFWVLDERGGSLQKWRIFWGIGITAGLSLPWFWLAFRENGYAFIATFFINHNLTRFVSDIHHHSQPFYYYLPVLLGLLLPWSGWLPLLFPRSPLQILKNWRHWDRRLLFLVSWAAIPILFFSLSNSKLPGYILPSLPAFALLLGVCFAEWQPGPIAPTNFRIALGCHLFLAAGISIAAPIVFYRNYEGSWRVGLMLSLVVTAFALASLFLGLKKNWLGAFYATLMCGFVLVMAIAQFAFPVLGVQLSAKGIAQQAIALRQKDEPIVTFLYSHHSLSYYTDYQVAEAFQDLDSMGRYLRAHPRMLVIADQELAPALRHLQGITIDVKSRQGKLVLMELSR